VINGHALPLTLECIRYLKNISIASIGVVKQETIDEHGNAVTKFRMTHDQSFPAGPSSLSVNSWLIIEKLSPWVFGFCLKRILHYIVSLRSHHPNTRILMSKCDFKSGYCQFNLSAQTALESITSFDELLFISLWMTLAEQHALHNGDASPRQFAMP